MTGLTRRNFIGGVVAATAITARSGAQAQGVPSALLQPGMRIIWLGAASSMPGERQQLEPDPNGGWINKATGQHYHEFETPGPAGAGYSVMDVLSADPNGFLINFSHFLIHTESGNATTFLTADALPSGPEAIGDFWTSPTRLAGMTDISYGGARILHMPYPLNGHSYRAVRLQNQNGDGWSQTTYDVDSGLLLVSSSTAQGSPVLIRDPNNQLTTGAGSTMMTYGQFISARHTNLPGPGSTYPDAIRKVRAITYSGTRGIVMSGTDMQVPPSPAQVRYDISANAGPYLNARMSVSGVYGAPGSAEDRIVPAGTVGSLWMNPNTLIGYRQGELLDQDPVTGVQITVYGRQGNLIFIIAQTPLARQSFGYDLRSGLLAFADLRQQVGPATDILTVQLEGTQ
ncbi:hypothetical protein SAMN05444161_4545 [Rhizobiales bacterium GAS191]|nr:hypothetical protein SAMN05444161_4545 [Rhizobiales bacterium GAS191]